MYGLKGRSYHKFFVNDLFDCFSASNTQIPEVHFVRVTIFQFYVMNVLLECQKTGSEPEEFLVYGFGLLLKRCIRSHHRQQPSSPRPASTNFPKICFFLVGKMLQLENLKNSKSALV